MIPVHTLQPISLKSVHLLVGHPDGLFPSGAPIKMYLLFQRKTLILELYNKIHGF
jgi:hypothetical protein